MTEIPVPDAQSLISDLEVLKVFSDPLRMRIMRAMATRPRSVKELAEELEVPFTRLYYHIRLLEHYDLIRVVDIRSVFGAAEEKYYQIAAREFVVDRKLMSVDKPDVLEAILAANLDFLRNAIQRSVRDKTIDVAAYPPDPKSLMLRHGPIRLKPERAKIFYEKLLALIQEMHDAESSDGEFYGLLFSLFPMSLTFEEERAEDDPN